VNDSFDNQLHVEVVSNTAMRNFIVECKPESVRGKPRGRLYGVVYCMVMYGCMAVLAVLLYCHTVGAGQCVSAVLPNTAGNRDVLL